MSDSHFLLLARAVERDELPRFDAAAASLYRRAGRALAMLRERPVEHPGDVAALLAQAMRTELAGGAASDLRLTVAGTLARCDPRVFARAGLEVVDSGSGRRTLVARPWRPAWLPGAEFRSPIADVLTGVERRELLTVRGDPFLAALGLTTYRCSAQRQAVRAAMAAPAGSTLLVNLPTGAGKSLVAHLAPLLDSNGLTVFVVPTVTLALDQERQLRERAARMPWPLVHATAYIGDGDESERAAIRARIRDGTQRVLFAAPESLVRSLVPRFINTRTYDLAGAEAAWHTGLRGRRPEYAENKSICDRVEPRGEGQLGVCGAEVYVAVSRRHPRPHCVVRRRRAIQ